MDFDPFEEQAKLFYNATGMLPPGKDDSLGLDTREERQKAWGAWCFQRKRIAELEGLLRDIVEAAHVKYIFEEVGGAQWATMPAEVIQAAAKALGEGE